MGVGCALIFIVFLIISFVSSLALIPEHGIYAIGFAALIGYAIYALIIKPIIEDNKSSTSSTSTTSTKYTPPKYNHTHNSSPSSSSVGKKKSKKKDEWDSFDELYMFEDNWDDKW